MAVPPNLRQLPEDFASTGDPIDGNPFAHGDVRHRVWSDATRAAEEELFRFTSEYTAETALTKGDNFLDVVTIAKFDAWARRGIHVVWSDSAMQHYDRWLVSYADAWLEEVNRFYESHPPPLSPAGLVLELRTLLMRRVQYWKAEARRYRAAQETQNHHGASEARPKVSSQLVRRRKALAKKYRSDHGLTMADLARRPETPVIPGVTVREFDAQGQELPADIPTIAVR